MWQIRKHSWIVCGHMGRLHMRTWVVSVWCSFSHTYSGSNNVMKTEWIISLWDFKWDYISLILLIVTPISWEINQWINKTKFLKSKISVINLSRRTCWQLSHICFEKFTFTRQRSVWVLLCSANWTCAAQQHQIPPHETIITKKCILLQRYIIDMA